MTKSPRWKLPTPYGIQLETSHRVCRPLSDGRGEWVSDNLFGRAQTGDAQSHSHCAHLDRKSDAKIGARWPAHTRAKRKDPTPGRNRSEADEIDSNSSDATGQRRSRRCSGRDRNWIESRSTEAAGTFSRTAPSVSSRSNLQKRGAIAISRAIFLGPARSGESITQRLQRGKSGWTLKTLCLTPWFPGENDPERDASHRYHATPANSSACTLNCRSYSFR